MTIRKLYNEVIKQKNNLDNAIEQLSKKASEIYGKDLIADFCSGNEIEFRLSDYDNPYATYENDFCIETTIEELEKTERGKCKSLYALFVHPQGVHSQGKAGRGGGGGK